MSDHGIREAVFGGNTRDINLILITYILASPETVEREFGSLEQIPDNFPKYVVSMDELDMSRNGIKHCNIRKFLTMVEWG